jgi:flagellar motor switch protein FliN/FliY
MANQETFVAPSDSSVGGTAEADQQTSEQRNEFEGGRNLETIMRIPVVVQVVLGSASMAVANLLKIGRGAVIPLDRRVGEPVDITVNGRIVARGEVVVVEDDNSRFGVSLTEIVGPPSFNSNS